MAPVLTVQGVLNQSRGLKNQKKYYRCDVCELYHQGCRETGLTIVVQAGVLQVLGEEHRQLVRWQATPRKTMALNSGKNPTRCGQEAAFQRGRETAYPPNPCATLSSHTHRATRRLCGAWLTPGPDFFMFFKVSAIYKYVVNSLAYPLIFMSGRRQWLPRLLDNI